jgi:5-methylthioadenosine/S-adenosylhomocysteine deaminase
MEKVDILLKNADWLITMNQERTIIQDGALAIRQDRIVEVGKSGDLANKYEASQEIDCADNVVLPGMIDSHVHSAFQMSRGLADEVGEQAFLFERMYPYEGCMDEEDTYWSATLCALELLKHGVTCFIDPGNYEIDQTAKAIEKAGMRCALSKSSLDMAKSSFGGLPEKFIETTDQALERSEALAERWHNRADGRIKVFFSFRGLNNSTDQLIIGMKNLADKYKTGIQTHCAFAQKTRDASLAQHGLTEVDRLDKLDVLDANLVLSHVGWLSAKELNLLKEYGVKAVACPSSSVHNGYGNLLMGTIPLLMEMGVPMGIGSDHASSGIIDVCQEMRLVGTALKEIRLDPKVMPPERVLEMATVNGAECALWKEEIGSLEPGKKADITIFDTHRPEWQPLYANPLVNLVYSATGSSVDTVLVDGKVLVEGGRALSIDEEEVYGQVKRLKKGILQKTGLLEKIRPKWPIL